MGNSDLIYQLKFIQAKYKLVFVQNLALGSSVSIPGKVINKYIFTGSINSKRILFNLTLMLSALSEKHTYFCLDLFPESSKFSGVRPDYYHDII